jgi:hypothetical protein
MKRTTLAKPFAREKRRAIICEDQCIEMRRIRRSALHGKIPAMGLEILPFPSKLATASAADNRADKNDRKSDKNTLHWPQISAIV